MVSCVISGVEPDPFTIAVFQQLSMNADSKPAVLARAIMPLLQAAPLPAIPKPNLKVPQHTTHHHYQPLKVQFDIAIFKRTYHRVVPSFY